MKKLFCIVLSMILILSVPVNVQAASKKETTAVKKAVTTLMDANINYNPSKIKKCFKNPSKITCVGNKTWQKQFRTRNKAYFKYKIKKVTVNGKKASVKLSYESYSYYYNIWYAFKKMLFESNGDNLFRYMYEFEIKYQLGSSQGYYAYRSKTYKATVTIPLVKVNGKWKIEKMNKGMKRMFDCGIQAAMDDIHNDPMKLLSFN